MSRARNVKDQDFQEITQSTAVPARRSGAIPIGSPFSLQKGTPWECTFLLFFKTAITLKLKLQIKLCSCPLGSMYCLKKCPDTISAEYARWLQHNYNIPIPANKCSIQNKHILRNKSNLPLGQCSVFLQGQYPNKIWSIPWTVAPSPLKECSVHFQISNPHFKGAVPLLEKSIFLHDICSIIGIGHPLQKCNMFETVSTTICSNNVWLS